MSGWTGGLDTASLVDRNVHDHCARLHVSDGPGRNQFGRRTPGHEGGSDYYVRRCAEGFNRLLTYWKDTNFSGEALREPLDGLSTPRNEGDIGAHANGHFRSA